MPSYRKNKPFVSVLMSVYNGERFLHEAINSILNQTFKNFEFLIVNDGSTDNTSQILESFNDSRIRIINNNVNIGLTKSLNLGLAVAEGEFIARQDADDVSLPERLAKQVDVLLEHTEITLLGTQAFSIDEHGLTFPRNPIMRKATTPVAIRWQLLFDSAFIHTSVMFRRSIVYDKLEGYDEQFVKMQDMDLWYRISQDYEVANLSEYLVAHRISEKSVAHGYTKKDIQKLNNHLVLRLRQALELEESVVSGWINFWSAVTNAHLKQRPIGATAEIQNLNFIVQEFSRRYCGESLDNELARCLASVHYRVISRLLEYNYGDALKWYNNALWATRSHGIKISWRLLMKAVFSRRFLLKMNSLYRNLRP